MGEVVIAESAKARFTGVFTVVENSIIRLPASRKLSVSGRDSIARRGTDRESSQYPLRLGQDARRYKLTKVIKRKFLEKL
ncbi:MAG: hypothetical protein K2Z81_28330 [Cyanobacteria bacterium]|nr:hypothetical protein [Cyanobacteriota bacterium]